MADPPATARMISRETRSRSRNPALTATTPGNQKTTNPWSLARRRSVSSRSATRAILLPPTNQAAGTDGRRPTITLVIRPTPIAAAASSGAWKVLAGAVSTP